MLDFPSLVKNMATAPQSGQEVYPTAQAKEYKPMLIKLFYGTNGVITSPSLMIQILQFYLYDKNCKCEKPKRMT